MSTSYENRGERDSLTSALIRRTFGMNPLPDGSAGKLEALGRTSRDHRKRSEFVLWKKFENYMVAYRSRGARVLEALRIPPVCVSTIRDVQCPAELMLSRRFTNALVMLAAGCSATVTWQVSHILSRSLPRDANNNSSSSTFPIIPRSCLTRQQLGATLGIFLSMPPSNLRRPDP